MSKIVSTKGPIYRGAPYDDVNETQQEQTITGPQIAAEEYPGFVIICRTCGSARVCICSDVGFSEESGSWGDVRLKCLDCQKEVVIFDAN